MKLKFRTVFWTAAAIGIAAVMVIAFQPRPIAVDVTEVERGRLTVAVRDEARTRVRDVYDVTAPIAGHLLRPQLRAGDRVDAGDVIARILPEDPPLLDSRAEAEARAALRSAEAALAAARIEAERAAAELANQRIEAERITTLFGRELVSREAYDRSRLALNVAEAAATAATENVRVSEASLDAARVRLMQPGHRDGTGDTVDVRAPVSGSVLRVAQESEGVVSAGSLLLTLGDPGDLEIVAELLSTDAVQIAPGAEVRIENWGGRDTSPLAGRVRLVEPFGFLKVSALGVEEQRVNVIIDFADPPEQWSSLGHGFRVEVAVVTWEREDVVQLPVAALFRSGGDWAVFRVENGQALLTPVEVGRDNGRQAEILGGINPGTTIVLYPGEQVSDGTPVRPRE
jgi:HlyD family secretion protein